jgi:hypothetical protein
MSLLEKFVDSTKIFRPATVQEFLALQVARKVGDPDGFRWYVHALSGMAQADVLMALKRASLPQSSSDGHAERFRKALKNSTNFPSHE